jgi:hypothetical protein
MAKLKVSAEFLANVLFGQTDKRSAIAITGAAHDLDPNMGHVIILDVIGKDVPQCEKVEAIFSVRSPMTVEFKAVN